MDERNSRLPGLARTSLGFLFGISLSLLLVSLWGRSVTADPVTLGSAAAEAARVAVVSDRIVEWLAGELAEQPVSALQVGDALRKVVGTPEGDAAISGFAAEAAEAFAGGDSRFDPRPVIRPLVPQVTAALAASGISVEQVRLAAAVESLEPLDLSAGGQESRAARAWSAGARAGLRTAALVAAGTAIMLGAALVWWAPDRRTALREIAQRVTFGGLGFVAMFHLGAWALDPHRGGSDSIPSLRKAGAILLRSNLHVPLLVGMVGAAAWFVARRRPGRQSTVESAVSTEL